MDEASAYTSSPSPMARTTSSVSTTPSPSVSSWTEAKNRAASRSPMRLSSSVSSPGSGVGRSRVKLAAGMTVATNGSPNVAPLKSKGCSRVTTKVAPTNASSTLAVIRVGGRGVAESPVSAESPASPESADARESAPSPASPVSYGPDVQASARSWNMFVAYTQHGRRATRRAQAGCPPESAGPSRLGTVGPRGANGDRGWRRSSSSWLVSSGPERGRYTTPSRARRADPPNGGRNPCFPAARCVAPGAGSRETSSTRVRCGTGP